jgi:glyoxylase-like metal-dependent hydrolase (beta-lactamase superfamily II)
MRVTKAGNLIQVSFMPNFFPVNCYLVEEEKELTLIDAALPFSVKGILQAAEQLGKPITRIALTHAHDDHVGALDALKERIPNIEVYISRRESKLLAGSAELEPGELNTRIKGGVPKSVKTRADILLEAAALEFAQRLRQLSPTLLAVGHGLMLENPLHAMDKAIEEAIKAQS